jgi:hypothetical protein
MPAINPAVLNEKIDALLSGQVLAGSFAGEIEAILSFYADRTKRSTAAAAALEPTERMRVPSPVLRTICTKIHQRRLRADDEWLPAARRLWRSGLQEMQLVGICMLGEVSRDELLKTASQWAAESDDLRVLRSLASEGIHVLRVSNKEDLLEIAQGWLEDASTRAFGLLVLRQLFEDTSIHGLPAVLDKLSGLTASVRGVEVDALDALLGFFAARSPAETTAFLMDEIAAADTKSIRFVRKFSHSLPEPYQSQLLQSI